MDELWDLFQKSGRVEDYLNYRYAQKLQEYHATSLSEPKGDAYAVFDQSAGAQS